MVYLGHRVIVIADDSGQVVGYTSNYDPFIEVDSLKPQISHDKARDIVLSQFFSPRNYAFPSEGKLAIRADRNSGKYYLCWPIETSSSEGGSWLYLIDAVSGDVLDKQETVWHSHGHIAGLTFPEHSRPSYLGAYRR